MQDKVEMPKADLRKIWNDCGQVGKELLENQFGKDMFVMSITDRINTLDDIFALVPPTEDQKTLFKYSGTDPKVLGAKNFMLGEMIVEAYHEGKLPDHTNQNQRKYEPWYDGSKGFAFGHAGYGDWYSATCCGSRLCWLDPKLMRDAHAKFPEVFQTIVKKY